MHLLLVSKDNWSIRLKQSWDSSNSLSLQFLSQKALASDDTKNGLISQMPLLLIANCFIPLEKTPETNSLKMVVMILVGGVTLSLDVPIF